MSYIWPVVRELAKTQLDQAADAARWIFELDPAFVPPVRKSIALGYRTLGFSATERLVGLQAGLRGRGRRP